MSDHGHHIIPFRTLLNVFIALIVLTVLTVITARTDLGALNFLHVPIAITIAMIKTVLVVTIFMGLRYDNRVNALTIALGGVFVIIFIAFTLFDTVYRGDMGNVDTLPQTDREALEEEIRAREPDPEQLRVAPSDFPAEEQPAGQ